jgi:hypothetical protein
MNLSACIAAICLSAAALPSATGAEEKNVTWTGWFSDLECAAARASGGKFGPTNPDCARNCIQKGTPPAFISEQAKAVFVVKDYPGAIDDLGYRVEVQATVDSSAKTLVIRKVTRLEYQGPACARPRKPAPR